MRLLIIDDDRVSAFVSRWAAKTSGIFRSVNCVESGREGLRVLERASRGWAPVPDVLLLDLNMPVMSGFEVMERIKELSFPGQKAIRIVILTSSKNAEDIERARCLGAKDYLVKPLRPMQLQKRLASLQTNMNRHSMVTLIVG